MANLKTLLLNNENIFNLIYPIGSIFQTTNADINPTDLFGGTWKRIKGKVLVGVDEDDEDFKISQIEIGEKEHTLTIEEMPSHNHSWRGVNALAGEEGWFSRQPFRIAPDLKENFSGSPGCLEHTGGGSRIPLCNPLIQFIFMKG